MIKKEKENNNDMLLGIATYVAYTLAVFAFLGALLGLLWLVGFIVDNTIGPRTINTPSESMTLGLGVIMVLTLFFGGLYGAIYGTIKTIQKRVEIKDALKAAPKKIKAELIKTGKRTREKLRN